MSEKNVASVGTDHVGSRVSRTRNRRTGHRMLYNVTIATASCGRTQKDCDLCRDRRLIGNRPTPRVEVELVIQGRLLELWKQQSPPTKSVRGDHLSIRVTDAIQCP